MADHPSVFLTSSAAETTELGRALSLRLRPGDVVAFHGDLGAGKTTMIKGIAAGLGVTDVVKSPSFVIVTEYRGRAGAHHEDSRTPRTPDTNGNRQGLQERRREVGEGMKPEARSQKPKAKRQNRGRGNHQERQGRKRHPQMTQTVRTMVSTDSTDDAGPAGTLEPLNPRPPAQDNRQPTADSEQPTADSRGREQKAPSPFPPPSRGREQREGVPVYHIDLYRLGTRDEGRGTGHECRMTREESEAIGLDSYLEGEGICLIEWAERGESFLPRTAIRVRMSVEGAGRRIEIEGLRAG